MFTLARLNHYTLGIGSGIYCPGSGIDCPITVVSIDY